MLVRSVTATDRDRCNIGHLWIRAAQACWRGAGVALVVTGEADGLGGDALEDIVDERVHDAHAALGDNGVRVHRRESSAAFSWLLELLLLRTVQYPAPLSTELSRM